MFKQCITHLSLLLGLRHLAALVIFTAAKDEVKRSSIKSVKSVQVEGWRWTAWLNKLRTFTQETAVHVQCGTRSQQCVTYVK